VTVAARSARAVAWPPDPEARPGEQLIRRLVRMRRALRTAVLTVIGGAVVAHLFADLLVAWLAQPMVRVWTELAPGNPGMGDPTLYFKSPTEPFIAELVMSLWAGVFLASPLLFAQLWRLVAPGLRRRAGLTWALALGSSAMFLGGALFCHQLVLPAAYRFLIGYGEANLAEMSSLLGLDPGTTLGLQPSLMIGDYLSLTRRLLLAFGLVFELPIVMFILSWLGLVTARGLWRFNRWAIVLSFAVAAVLTPGPDVISQVMLAAPMVVFYNLSIAVAWMVERRRSAQDLAY
jgi:sec-independent protein translocase protein TatC